MLFAEVVIPLGGSLADHWESRLKAWKLEAVGPRHKAGGTDEIDGSLTEVAEPERQAWPELCRPRPARRGGPVKMVDSRGAQIGRAANGTLETT